MRRTRPLQDHPELVVIDTPDLCREYRVENWRIARDGSNKIVHGATGFGLLDAALVLAVAIFWRMAYPHRVKMAFLIAVVVYYVYAKCTQVLWESVVALPELGVQLETHRGFPPRAFTISRKFIPLFELQDVIVNEGLRRWDVRYYLALLYTPSDGAVRLGVAFPHIIPRLAVIRHIYHDTREYLSIN